MGQIILNIENKKMELALLNISKERKISINDVVNEMLEKFLHLYTSKNNNYEEKESKKNSKLQNFFDVAGTIDLSLDELYNYRKESLI